MELAIDRPASSEDANAGIREALDDCEQRWGALLHELPGMVFRCVPDARWTFEQASPGAAQVLGIAPARLLQPQQPGWADFVHPEDLDPATAAVSEALATGVPYRIRYRAVGSDGRERHVSETGWGVRGAQGELVAREGYAWVVGGGLS